MCGIVGVVDFREEGRVPSAGVFNHMTDTLERRGPDGRGVFLSEHVVLGHRRLSIIDTTSAGTQPMVHDETGAVITYNGEVYNYREVRRELQEMGYGFKTKSDTEVLLIAYLAWGKECVRRFKGIFAFAVYDPRHKTVFLARDHLGVKPLFYSLQDGVLRFASEIKALLADPAQPREKDPSSIAQFLTLAYVPAPHTAFSDIFQLEPGHRMVLDFGEPLLRERYWRPRVRETEKSISQNLDELKHRLTEVCDSQMVSDVPLGAFLSGGLDSAVIVSEMMKLSKEPVKTFSIGFSESTYDESSAAARSAEILGSEHHTQKLSLDLGAQMMSIAETNCELFADSSMIAVDLLCKSAREHVTVALSGDGADEMLAGYSTYIATYLAAGFRKVPPVFRQLVHKAVKALPPSTKRYNQRDFALRFLEGTEAGPARDFASWRRYFSSDEKNRIMRADFFERELRDPIRDYARKFRGAGRNLSLLKRMLYADLTFYLPNDMLVKVDRASMRHGLEVRVPFLDHELVEFCLSIEPRQILGTYGRKKHVLKEHIRQQVAPEIADRKKRGFNVPIGEAFKNDLYEPLCDALNNASFRNEGPIDVDEMLAMAKAHKEGKIDIGMALYPMFVLANWFARF